MGNLQSSPGVKRKRKRDGRLWMHGAVELESADQVVLVLVGLFYSFWGYLLFDALWHSSWLNGHKDVLPMFLSLNTALGPCLLPAVKQPAKHRLMIACGAWSSLAHGFTMTIQWRRPLRTGCTGRIVPTTL